MGTKEEQHPELASIADALREKARRERANKNELQLPAYFRQDAEGHLRREDRPLMPILELLENARKHLAVSLARIDEACEKMKVMERETRKDVILEFADNPADKT